MKRTRPSFRATLDRLTQDFAQAVLDAACRVIVAEMLGPSSAAKREIAPASSAAPVRRASRVKARARKPKAVRATTATRREVATRDDTELIEGTEIDARAVLASLEFEPPPPPPAREAVAERDNEPPASAGTEIDAVGMLASLEGQAAVLEERPSPLPSILMTVPAADIAPTIALSAVARRAGEEILRTAGGGVVLRRRRGTQTAA
jgi:hypothetical protein